MKRAALAAAAALAFVLGSAPTPVVAAPCGVFTDVQSTDSFCNSVQWLKNRAVTLGCTSATLYCPTDVVTRASMALFINRLGIAITPKLIGLQAAMAAQAISPSQFSPFCATAVLPAVNYPQTVRARGSVAVSATGPALNMFLVVAMSGGGYQNMNQVSLPVTNPNGQQNLSWSSSTLTIPPGNSLEFAIGISNPSGSVGNLNLGAGNCAIEAEVVNANPNSAPFDD
jgi:hypothetical protein